MTALNKFEQLAPYIARAGTEPSLEREEELQLARLWKEKGDRAAAEKLTRAHLRVVVSIAHKYRRYGVPISDLIAEGNFGLAQALNKFEPERGLRFVTYASYWIRAFVLDHVIKSWSLVGAGAGALRSRVFFRLRRERTRIANVLGAGEEADRALAERLGISVEAARRMVQRLDARDISIEVETSGESRLKLLDTLQSNDNQEHDVLQKEVEASVNDAIGRAIAELDVRERYITERRLMADPSEELSLAEIGRELGVSRERARQLESRTKSKLKSRIPALGGAVVDEWLREYEPPARLAAAR